MIILLNFQFLLSRTHKISIFFSRVQISIHVFAADAMNRVSTALKFNLLSSEICGKSMERQFIPFRGARG